MIICIDDTRYYTDPNAENYPTAVAGLMRVVQLWTAQNMFSEGNFNIDELWLDHDMGWGTDNSTLVQWLYCCGMMDNGLNVDHIYVHSANPAADYYVDRLQAAKYIVSRVNIIDVVGNGLLREYEYERD